VLPLVIPQLKIIIRKKVKNGCEGVVPTRKN
jgi:hypothetical protein